MSTTNPLGYLVIEAQKIVIAASVPQADTESAIKALGELLCTPPANLALLEAGFSPAAEQLRAAELAAA